MTLTKSISAQENLNKHNETENSLTDCISFSDFDKLILNDSLPDAFKKAEKMVRGFLKEKSNKS